MKILLNGQPLDVEELTPEVTLAGLMAAIRDDLKKNGLTIVELIADETHIDPDDLAKLEGKRVLDCQSVEFIAATAKQLLQAGVNDSAVIVPHVEEQALAIAGDLRIGKVKEAMDAFLELIDGLEWLSTMLANLEQGFAGAMQESGLEMRRKQLLERINQHIEGLRNSQENQDWVGLADILEYEFPDLFKESLEIFGKLKSANETGIRD
ncbi:hypothetical protein AUK22_10505 [bacterium CG2_30_54_10]|nr:MAG: hypothetical protein AUK22_10505 [bacterium CG2_30_54_10]